MPLTMAAGACERSDMQELKSKAEEFMRNTDVDDAIEVYKAFSTGKVKVRRDVSKFDEELIRDGINPGSTADIIAAALFITILDGLRF
jgi:triphosphoribosyl-dephospho-CoA synthetase